MAKKVAQKDVVKKVLDDFNSSWEYCQGSWHQRWLDNFSLYNNNRVKRGYQGITDTFVPMAFTTVETMTAALFGTKPKFNYLPPSDKPDQNTDILNSLLDFFWDKDQWTTKMINGGRSMLQVGTSIFYAYWNIDHPCIINIPIRDFFIDPTATRLEEARYMGRRYLTTKKHLEEFEVVDPETGEMIKKYKNLDKVTKKGGNEGDETDKQKKDMFYGSTVSSYNNEEVEVIEWCSKDRIISIANRSVVIEDTENWYKAKARNNGQQYPEGLFPYVSFRDYTDESLFYAKGEIDFIADQQELLNDITNQNNDAITYTLNQMYTLDPKYANMINEIENLPGAVYPVESGALQPISQRPIPGDAFQERLNLKSDIRETSASNEVVRGIGTEGGKVTATEIQAQIAGAGQRLGLKVSQMENEGFYQLAKLVFKMIQLYVTEPMMVRIIGDKGTEWQEFNPEEFYGDYEPRVQLSVTIENQKQQEATTAKELLAAFLNDPEINQTELKRIVLRQSFDLEPDEVDMLLTNPMSEEMPGMEPMLEEGLVPPENEMPVEELAGLMEAPMYGEEALL